MVLDVTCHIIKISYTTEKVLKSNRVNMHVHEENLRKSKISFFFMNVTFHRRNLTVSTDLT